MSAFERALPHPNQVVGQDRALRLMTGYIEQPVNRTRGYIFTGPHGVGTSSLARLFAKALMCTAQKVWDCSTCPSCKAFGQPDPDFTEVSGRWLGEQSAKTMTATRPPVAARRRVVLIEEAERLPDEVWEVLRLSLLPLEVTTVLLFTTTERKKIPQAMEYQLAWLPLQLIPRDALLGMLVSLADREQIPYTLDGLNRIAFLAQGSPREAIRMLETVAITGAVTPKNLEAILVEDMTLVAIHVFACLLAAAQRPEKEALRALVEGFNLAEQRAQLVGPNAVIRALFSYYAGSLFAGCDPGRSLPDYHRIHSVFLRWLAVPELPIDAISLFLMELLEHFPGRLPALIADPVKRSTFGRPTPHSSLVMSEHEVERELPGSLTVEEMKRMAGVL